MNQPEYSLSPCPECGGPRALFKCEARQGQAIFLHIGFRKRAQLYACTCFTCGTTTLRPAPAKMEEVRQWAQTHQPFKLS